MNPDVEQQCLKFRLNLNNSKPIEEQSEADKQVLLRLHEYNFWLPELSHLILRQVAAELNVPMYPVARAVFFSGLYYFQRDIQNPKISPYLYDFLEEHSSLIRDKKGEVEEQEVA